MAAPITFGGLASGLDTNSIISSLVAVERQPIDQLQTQKQNEASQKSIVDDLTTKMTALSTALQPLSTQVGVQGRSVTVAPGAPFTATAQSGAALGDYNVTVNQLAQAQRTYSNSFAGADTAGLLGAGTINLNIGTSTASISLTGADTLNTVASKINGSGLRLTAAVVYDGTNYRLVVNGQDPGQKNAISISDSGTGLGLEVPANTVVPAQDALLSIDGISVRSASNTVSGTIPGVSLTLNSVSPVGVDGKTRTPTNVAVGNDPSQLESTLKGVVDAYNAVMGEVNKQFPQSGSSTQLGPDTLVGDSSIRELQAALFNIPVTTAGPAGNSFGSLTEIGVTVDRYGAMTLDTKKLEAALSQDSAGVTNLLAGTDGQNGLVKKISDTINGYTDFVSGVLPAKSKSLQDQMSSIDDEVARLELQATAYEDNLRQEFTAMEQLVSSYQSQGSALSSFTNLGSSSNNNSGGGSSSSSSSSGTAG